jgi:hypothetical protein
MIRTTKTGVFVSFNDIDKFMTLWNIAQGTAPQTAQRNAKAEKPKVKLSLNNPYVVFSDDLNNKTQIEVKEGWAHFSNPEYKSGRENGYCIEDMRKAQEMFVAGLFDEQNAKTGVKMAKVNDYKVSETLVKLAEAKNLL